MTLYLSYALFEFRNGVRSEIQPLDRTGVFRKSSFEFFERLSSTLNIAAQQSQKENVHKFARQETEGFTHLLKTYISPVEDADLPEDEILNYLTLMFRYIYRFWKKVLLDTFFQQQN